MAAFEKISWSNIFSGSLLGPGIKELEHAVDLTEAMLKNVQKISTKSISNVEPTSVENINRINKAVDDMNKLYGQTRELNKERLKLNKRLVKAQSDEGKELEKLRQKVKLNYHLKKNF